MQKMASSFEHMTENASSPDVIAKIVHKAVTSENPSPMYVAGKDAETLLDTKRKMSDEEFYKMMKQSLI